MQKYKNVIFDFDGTIADTSEGVLQGVRYALDKINGSADKYTTAQLRGFIGPVLNSSFQKITKLTPQQTTKAIELYREKYISGAMFKCKLYDGMIEVFTALNARGVKISVASSKPHSQLLKVIEYLGLTKYFSAVVGALDDINNDKSYLINKATVATPAIMVGDSIYDIMGATKANIPCVAVGYGFGNIEEMKGYAPAYFAESVSKLKEILLQITE